MSWYNPFSWFQESTPFDKPVKIYYVSLRPMPGFSQKEILKDVSRIFGKKLEKRMIVFRGMIPIWTISPFDTATYKEATTAKELVEKYLQSFASSASNGNFRVSTSPIAGHVENEVDASKLVACQLEVRDISQEVECQLGYYINTSAHVYYRKTRDSKIFSGKMIDKCPMCSASFIEEWVDEDGDDQEPCRIDNTGSCNNCDFHIGSGQIKDPAKVFRIIRKFEEESGVSILPKVA